MKSLVSYPKRGAWGDSQYRGNCSGFIIKDLIDHFKPKLFVDVCEGSGTSGQVCSEMGIQYVGLDLHKGHDFTHDYVLNALPCPGDIVWSHPPYSNIIKYSGHVYGDKPIKNDTSHCDEINQFLAMSQVMLMNQREATRDGGIYTSLIGDIRKNGSFRSLQSDFISMMPKSELISVVVKAQHNCKSDYRSYSGSFIPILHEYLLIWRKSRKSLFTISYESAKLLQKQIATTWRTVIRIVMMKLGKPAPLSEIYKEVEKVAGDKIASNENWKAQIRQKLQEYHVNVQRGVWSL